LGFGDGTTSKVKSPTHTFSAPGYYLVSLQITNASNYSDYKFELINISMPDSFVVSFGHVSKPYDKKAGGYPVDFIGAGLGDDAKLKWSFGDDSTDNTTNTPTHTYQDTGKYEVCLTYSDPVTGQEAEHCEWVTTEQICKSDTIDPEAICKALTVSLNSSGYVDITAAQMDNGSNDDCGIASRVLSQTRFTSADTYKDIALTVTDNNGNVSKFTNTVTVLKGNSIQDASMVADMETFPNPFKDQLNVTYNLYENASIELTITDLAGKQVWVIRKGSVAAGSYTEVYDASMIDCGTYIMQLKTNKGIRKQLVIIKN